MTLFEFIAVTFPIWLPFLGIVTHFVLTHPCLLFGHDLIETGSFNHGMRRSDDCKGVVGTKAKIYACKRNICDHTELGPYRDE